MRSHLLFTVVVLSMLAASVQAQSVPATNASANPLSINLAIYAKPSASFVSPHESLEALNDGFEPRNSRDHGHGAFGDWPQQGTQWVQYEWPKAITANQIAVYWWADGRGVHLPQSARLFYFDGTAFKPVEGAAISVEANHYNIARFNAITTTQLRVEFESADQASVGILEWKVFDAGNSPKFAPPLVAGPERTAVLPAKTYLNATVRGPAATLAWTKSTGPGDVTFADPASATTTAAFSVPGDYVLTLTAKVDDQSSADHLAVHVRPPLDLPRLEPVYTHTYRISSPLWTARLKPLITTWIPHCIAEIENPRLKEGGLDNFVQAGNKLAGKPYAPHVGAPFANAWVLNTVEAMSVALTLDPQGDADIQAAQQQMRATLDRWIPIILAAQEPDGYLQTRFTLGTPAEVHAGRQPPRWTLRGEHEGYVGGYFIEAAIAHHLLTGGQDHRLYDAAKKLADCWDAHIGPPPKIPWFDGHQEIEQALVRLGRYVNQVEGAGAGDKYIALAKTLLDDRHGGSSYDQSHVPVTQQYEALGHAVRAAYQYSAMADVALQTHDPDYQSAVFSLWDSLVNKKYYLTGGIGSGDTSEGFGPNYALRNNSYCESCSNCGNLFFQWKLNLATHDARYADLYEEDLYNAILGDYDLSGKNFTYTNALDSDTPRYPWHNCPCCVGNFPRTLLMLPTWTYATGDNAIYVNLFIGSTMNVPNVAGSDVQMVQQTDYPWNGHVAITVNPAASKSFAIYIRVPNRSVSTLYSAPPEANGLTSLSVNGQAISPTIDRGYAIITRQWTAGDKVEFDLPLQPYRVKSIEQVAADRGRVALKSGPLVYNIESVDQNLDQVLPPGAALIADWQRNLLGGVRVIKSTFADGSPLLAVPNYARLNRGGHSIVWIRDE